MNVIDERQFLEEVARRINKFFRDFPIEAHRLFGEPRAFGYEVEAMFRQIVGRNVEVPFAVLLQSILTSGRGTESGPVLKMVWDAETEMLVAFQVVEAKATTSRQVINDAKQVLGLPEDPDPQLN